MKRAVIVIMIIMGPSIASARRCDRPDPPICLMSLGMADQFTFDSCRSNIEQYRREVIDFLECSRRVQSDVSEELGAAIRKFNACATNKYC